VNWELRGYTGGEFKGPLDLEETIQTTIMNGIEIFLSKFLIVAAEGVKVVEINHFGTLKESKRIFEEIASDYRYRPSKINSSGRLDVSIWKWTENRYVRLRYTDKLKSDLMRCIGCFKEFEEGEKAYATVSGGW
jgi:hypothetical protein